MPNAPRPDNPARTIRIDNNLWAALKRHATKEQVAVSVIVRRALERYVR